MLVHAGDKLNIDYVLNYVLALFSVVLLVPIFCLLFVQLVIDPSTLLFTITVAGLSCLITFVLKRILMYQYPEVFDNPFAFSAALLLSALLLYCVRSMLSMNTLTVILTLAGMFISYIGLGTIVDLIKYHSL